MKVAGIILICFLLSRNVNYAQQEANSATLNGGQMQAYNRALADALEEQLKADSLKRLARDKRILHRESPDMLEKDELAIEIKQIETDAAETQEMADSLFAVARQTKQDQLVGLPVLDSAVNYYTSVNGIHYFRYRMERKSPGLTDRVDQAQVRPLNGSPANAGTYVRPQTSPSTPSGEKNSLNESGSSATDARQDEFSISDHSPYGADTPFQAGLKPVSGLCYRIQLGVFSRPLPYDTFEGIQPVVTTQDGSIYKYYAGLFYSMNSVNQALESVRSMGHTDAFVVAFLNGDLISTEEAREIEYARFKL